MKKEFRVSRKQRNEFIFLVNTINKDEFYLLDEYSHKPDKQIYSADELIITGRFVEIIHRSRPLPQPIINHKQSPEQKTITVMANW